MVIIGRLGHFCVSVVDDLIFCQTQFNDDENTVVDGLDKLQKEWEEGKIFKIISIKLLWDLHHFQKLVHT